MQKVKVKVRAFSIRGSIAHLGRNALIGSILSCTALFSISPAQAAGNHYVCQIERFTFGANALPLELRRNFQVELWLDEIAFRAVVLDPLIEREFGGQIPARLSPSGNARFKFSWMLSNAPLADRQWRGRMEAHAVFRKTDGALKYDVVSAETAFSIVGMGKCKKQ